jgi:vancomycin permeability regulator SanA
MNVRAVHLFPFLAVCLVGCAVVFGIALFVQNTGERMIVQPGPRLRPARSAILVLGASVHPDGTPSDALIDRVKTGVSLWRQELGPSLWLTGDDGRFRSPEISAMQSLAESLGMPSAAIETDGEGYRTYESCKRAKEQGIEDALIVTQRFHLARALYLCSRLGMTVRGVAADLQPYQEIRWFALRDLLASVKAWWDINIHTPKPPV